MPAQRVDPLFRVRELDTLTDADLAAVAAGTLAAVRMPGFLDGGQCAAIAAAVARLPIQAYDPARVPVRILRFGPAINDYRAGDGTLDPGYWPAADAARAAWARAGIRPDPITHALGHLGTAWSAAITPATIDGRPVFGGTVREINAGALVHFDELVREFPAGLFDAALVAQLAVNVWVSAPEQGGETTIWRRRWQPDDEDHRTAYGYTRRVVAGVQHVQVRPRVGDALVFNPANLHAVEPVLSGRRLAFAFFLGLTTTGQLVTWS